MRLVTMLDKTTSSRSIYYFDLQFNATNLERTSRLQTTSIGVPGVGDQSLRSSIATVLGGRIAGPETCVVPSATTDAVNLQIPNSVATMGHLFWLFSWVPFPLPERAKTSGRYRQCLLVLDQQDMPSRIVSPASTRALLRSLAFQARADFELPTSRQR
jgi:hypothetical protein